MAGFLDSLVSIATGGLGKQVTDLVTAYFPPDMSPEKKLQFQIDMQKLENDRALAVDEATDKAEQALNERISIYEGTASDLKSIPVLGAVMLFLRGSFRPVMAYAVMYMDIMTYSGAWSMPADEEMRRCFYVINFLVLGFFFGERAIQNIMPLVVQFLSARKAGV